MTAVAIDAPLAEIVDQVAHAPYPWVPVYREDVDDIIGIVSVKDLFRALALSPAGFQLKDCVREALTVPETLKADDLLAEMRRRRTHHAVVIDEYGGTAGLVTFEGLMERIVGEMGNEFSPSGSRIEVLADGSALIDGLALVADVNEQFGLHIDEDAYNTVGGYVLGRLGRRARLGDLVEVEGRTLRVEALDALRVARVWLSPPPAETGTAEEGEPEER